MRWTVSRRGQARTPTATRSASWVVSGGATRDAQDGLTLCTHRYYDPGTGRWLTRDPIGYNGGVNLYGYCQNDPVNRRDPNGTKPIWHDPLPHPGPALPVPQPSAPPTSIPIPGSGGGRLGPGGIIPPPVNIIKGVIIQSGPVPIDHPGLPTSVTVTTILGGGPKHDGPITGKVTIKDTFGQPPAIMGECDIKF